MTNNQQENQTCQRHFLGRYIFYIGVFVLIISMGLSYFLEKEEDVVLPIPIKLENVPSDLVAVADVSILEVHVRGRVKILEELKSHDVHYTIDLSKGKPGVLPIKVSKDAIHIPRKLTVVSVQPESLTINFEGRLEKMAPIVPDLCGAPAAGYVVSKVVITPSVVELSGPHSVIDHLTAIRTTPIDVNGLTETIKKKVALALKPELHIQAVGIGLVDVEIIVEEKKAEQSFDIPVEGKNTTYRYTITPSEINICIKGPIKNIEEPASSQEKLQVYIDLSGLKPGVYVRKVVISLPHDVVLVDAKPEVFTVKITK